MYASQKMMKKMKTTVNAIYQSLVSTSICRYLYTFSSLYLSRYTIHLMSSTEGIHLISPVPMISDVYLASISTRCIHCLVDSMMTCIYMVGSTSCTDVIISIYIIEMITLLDLHLIQKTD